MPEKDRVFDVVTDAELMCSVYWNRMHTAAVNLDISERAWPDAIQQMFLEEDGKGTRFQYPPVPFEVPVIDDVWDGNDRYFRIFREARSCQYLARDRMFDIYLRVKHPQIARHFGR